jgi:hypothetical protein
MRCPGGNCIQLAHHPRPRPTTCGQPDLGQHRPERRAATPVALGQAGHLLGEATPRAVGGIAAEDAADLQPDAHLRAAHAAIGQPPLRCGCAPDWRSARMPGRLPPDPRVAAATYHRARSHDALDMDIGQVRNGMLAARMTDQMWTYRAGSTRTLFPIRPDAYSTGTGLQAGPGNRGDPGTVGSGVRGMDRPVTAALLSGATEALPRRPTADVEPARLVQRDPPDSQREAPAVFRNVESKPGRRTGFKCFSCQFGCQTPRHRANSVTD